MRHITRRTRGTPVLSNIHKLSSSNEKVFTMREHFDACRWEVGKGRSLELAGDELQELEHL